MVMRSRTGRGAALWVVATAVIAATACSVPKSRTQTSTATSQPEFVTNDPNTQEVKALGADAPKGFLRPCQTVLASGGVVELACGEHQIVEFRKGASTGEADQDLNDVMEVLQARFGELKETRKDGRIDDFPVRISTFRTIASTGARGTAVAVSNSQGRYWVFACYRKVGSVNSEFCDEAISTAARAGGLAYVGAKAVKGFADGVLVVPKGCVSSENSRVTCKNAQLSWSPSGGKNASVLQGEAVARIESMALHEKVVLTKETRRCQLLAEDIECFHMQINSPDKGEELHFILAHGAKQEHLVVCSFSAFDDAGELPQPCSPVISLKAQAE